MMTYIADDVEGQAKDQQCEQPDEYHPRLVQDRREKDAILTRRRWKCRTR
ncbi:hypothetical protein [Anaerolinea thermolimosa]|nr:hypothetical protein [Anaerolinea thermolimosa]